MQKLIKLSLDRIKINVIYDNKIFDVDISTNIKLIDVCKQFSMENEYVYSLFNEAYYNTSKKICETNIKTGDIVFI